MNTRSALNEIVENARLATWGDILKRAPNQVGGLHASDAELVPLGGADSDLLLALNVDSVVEEIAHGLYDPKTAGYVAVAAALSDLAAVGATPIGLLLAVTLPTQETSRVQLEVAHGAREACDESGTYVLGGDTNEGDVLSVTCTAAGLVSRSRALTRIGARPGDVIVVTGGAGAGALFAAARRMGGVTGPFAPRPRLEAGRSLAGVASACMDTSDGLLATLDQLGRLNDVRMRITTPGADLLALDARAFAEASGISPLALMAVPHGDFELVATVPEAKLAEIRESVPTLLEVGRVEQGDGVFDRDRALPTARLRNMWAEHGGDFGAYVSDLVRQC